MFSIPYDNKDYKHIKNAHLLPMGGNELSILNLHDPIRNYELNNFSFINNWEKDFINNHDFILLKTTFLNEKPIYEIKIKKKILEYDIEPRETTFLVIKNINKNSRSEEIRKHAESYSKIRPGKNTNKKASKERFLSNKQKYFSNRFKVDGTIYISKDDFAIHKILYAVYEGKSKTPKYAINIEYTPNENSMFLNYISFNNVFK